VPATVLSSAIDEIVKVTAETYLSESNNYFEARQSNAWGRDKYFYDTLLDDVRERIRAGSLRGNVNHTWTLLDVGAGYGRDVVMFSQEPDIAPIALEISDNFIKSLKGLLSSGQLGSHGRVIVADMRDLSQIPDSSIQCVRIHATLHHLPVVGPGLGADSAVSEARRVLVRGGILDVLVKAGEGVGLLDTGEGLGNRFYQLFSEDLLRVLLTRHSFAVTRMEHSVEPRTSGSIDWLFSLAVAA